MPNVIEDRTFVMTNADNNNNKGWRIIHYDNHTYTTSNGRIGTTQSGENISWQQHGPFPDSDYESKIRSKLKKGYQEIEIMQSSSGAGTVKTASLRGGDIEQLAKNQIETSSSDVLDLVGWFARENIHQITSQTKITYNSQSGLFETPLGVVGMPVVQDARRVLVRIGDLVARSDFGSNFVHEVEQYCMRIPQDVGMRKFNPLDIFSGLNDVQKQNDILDSLEGSINIILAGGGKDENGKDVVEVEKIFNTRIEPITDSVEIKRIHDKYMRTLQSMHACAHLRPKRVFEVEIRQVKDQYSRDGAKMANIIELWHGTKVPNLLSILKGGLIIPPYDSRYCAGRMFGNGVYFSDQSSKSLNYAYGYWSGTKNDHCFMLLADVAMGEAYTPSGPSQNFPVKGYDSTFAKADKSGVRNNEMIVYRTSQCNITRLIEFTPQGR